MQIFGVYSPNLFLWLKGWICVGLTEIFVSICFCFCFLILFLNTILTLRKYNRFNDFCYKSCFAQAERTRSWWVVGPRISTKFFPFSILKLVFTFSTKNLSLTLKVQKRLGFGMFWVNLGQREPKWFSLPCNFNWCQV